MIREYSVTDTIKIGDRIKFRSPTFSGPTGAVWRKVNGFSNDGKPTVRFNTWPDFVVRKHEIIQIDSLADKGAIRPTGDVYKSVVEGAAGLNAHIKELGPDVNVIGSKGGAR